MYIEDIKKVLSTVEESIYYLEETDMACGVMYTRLCKKRRILKKAIKKLERLEVHK